MKQIIVVSDSHFNTSILKDIAFKHQNADLFLHAGDSEDYEANIYPFVSVKGNNDYLITDEIRIITFENLRILLTHGHKMYLSKENIVLKAKKHNCNVFIHGHTHVPYIEKVDDIYILNPGSLSYPRSVMGETYAIISIDDNKNVEIEIKQM